MAEHVVPELGKAGEGEGMRIKGHEEPNSGIDSLRSEWMNQPGSSLNGKENLPQKMLETAQSSLGESLWKGTLGTEEGRLGAAVAVAEVLRQSGIPGLEGTMSVRQLTAKLENDQHWTKDGNLDHARPGDLKITQDDSHGWISIVANDGFYTNLSTTGKWAEVKELRAHKGETFLLHPPENAE